jgi:transketolase
MHILASSRIRELTSISYSCRKNILKMMRNGEGHIGGAFSILDVITVLYNEILTHDPSRPRWADRDRFILSAGHKCLSLYATLAQQRYFDESLLYTYNTFNTKVPMHPDEKSLAGIEFPTGSLGHGLSVGAGMALAARLDKKAYRVFVALGDGEIEEGSVWEAAMSSSHHRLDNLIAIIDRNGLQVNGATSDVMDSSPLEDKFLSFGWQTMTIDGHDIQSIYGALKKVPFKKGSPSMIIADTTKCKGLSFAEGDFNYHHWHCEPENINASIEKVDNALKEEMDRIGK